MKSILEIYSTLWEAAKKKDRFIEETFVEKVYDKCHPKLVVVDLGGFTGEFSFSCLPFAEKIFTVEPDPIPFAKLKQYVEEFEIDERMKIFNLAISATDGPRGMDLTGAGGSRLLADGGSAVSSLTLKTFMEENNIDHIDILKVDIEGAEKEIFESEEFKELIPKIDMIIGEHDGFLKLKDYGLKVEGLPAGIYLATK